MADRGGTLLGLFIGLVIGVLIAFGVVWYLNKTPLPFQDKSQRAPKDRAESRRRRRQDARSRCRASRATRSSEKPRFEFYKILPGEQQATPAGRCRRPPATPAAADSRQLRRRRRPPHRRSTSRPAPSRKRPMPTT